MFILEIFWGIGIGTAIILLIGGAYEVYETFLRMTGESVPFV